MADKDDDDGCGCWGCVSLLLALIVLWALLFGVTVGGRHYGLSCSTGRGVEFHTGEPVDPRVEETVRTGTPR